MPANRARASTDQVEPGGSVRRHDPDDARALLIGHPGRAGAIRNRRLAVRVRGPVRHHGEVCGLRRGAPERRCDSREAPGSAFALVESFRRGVVNDCCVRDDNPRPEELRKFALRPQKWFEDLGHQRLRPGMQSVPAGSGELNAAAYDARQLAAPFREHARDSAARSISRAFGAAGRRGRRGFRLGSGGRCPHDHEMTGERGMRA